MAYIRGNHSAIFLTKSYDSLSILTCRDDSTLLALCKSYGKKIKKKVVFNLACYLVSPSSTTFSSYLNAPISEPTKLHDCFKKCAVPKGCQRGLAQFYVEVIYLYTIAVDHIVGITYQAMP